MPNLRITFIVFIILGFYIFSVQAMESFTKSPPWKSDPFAIPDPGVTSGFQQFNSVPGRFDRNGDGRIDLIISDRNGDGWGDYWATDRDFDGFTDDYQYDRNFDGKIDQWEYDSNHDGQPEKILVDANSDGKPEMSADLNPVTRAYSWSGNLPASNASSGLFASSRASRRLLAQGRAAFSM
ncbi:MAG: hypothetical protein HYW02_00390 [Deltaproteobacteria bacterium]|nr:hypothetical protein [Deltaproteobacteria bacterium]MBI3039544.1 hypothetical protein [bacterium]